jgi:putative ABC transport system permease protein
VAQGSVAPVGYGAFLLLAGLLLLGSLVAPALADAIGRLPASLGVTGRLARRNSTRVPTRTAANANALLIGVALVGLLSVVAASATASANQLVDRLFNADYLIQTNGFQGVPSGVADTLASDSQVASVGVVRGARAGLGPARISVSGANQAALGMGSVVFVSGSSSAAHTRADLFIDQKTATARHLSVGSSLQVTFPSGVAAATIAGVYQNNQLVGSWIMPLSQFESHFPAATVDGIVLVDMRPGAGATGRAQMAALTKQYPDVKVQNKAQLEVEQRNNINQLLSLFTALLVLALVIAFLGIANTLALSILERTRELGILRALGMSRRRLRAAVRWESVILSAVGAIEGLVFGVVVGVAVIVALRSQGIHVLVVPWGRLVVYLVVACLLGVLAAAFPARRAARLRILTAIAVPE